MKGMPMRCLKRNAKTIRAILNYSLNSQALTNPHKCAQQVDREGCHTWHSASQLHHATPFIPAQPFQRE